MAYIIGVGEVGMGKLHRDPIDIAGEALRKAVDDAQLKLADVNAMLCTRTISGQVMFGHVLGTKEGLNPKTLIRTIDCGGASPVVCIQQAIELMSTGQADVAAVVGSDALLSMSSEEFFKRLPLGKQPVLSVHIMFSITHCFI